MYLTEVSWKMVSRSDLLNLARASLDAFEFALVSFLEVKLASGRLHNNTRLVLTQNISRRAESMQCEEN